MVSLYNKFLNYTIFSLGQGNLMGTITVIPRFTRLLWQPKNRVNRKSRYTSHSIEEKNCQKNFYYTDILCYKIVLHKSIWTRSKKHIIENRVMEKRVIENLIIENRVPYRLCYYTRFTTTPEKNSTLMSVTTQRV